MHDEYYNVAIKQLLYICARKMDGRRVWVWVLIPPLLNVIELTSSTSLSQNDKPRDIFEALALTNPVENEHTDELRYFKRNRFYRQAESETVASIELTATESNTPFEKTDWTEKYATLKSEIINNTVIPLFSTVSYDSTYSEQLETKEIDNVLPTVTTDNPDALKVSKVKKDDTAIETMDQIKVQEKEDSTSSLNLKQTTESVITSIHPLNLTNRFGDVESPDQLGIIGVPEKGERIEMIMTRQPSKKQKYTRVMEMVHNLLQGTWVTKETEEYVLQLHRRYSDLPVDESDNLIWRKFSRAVVESFMLDFYKNYPYATATEHGIDLRYTAEEYDSVYNTSLLNLQRKRGDTAIQFAASVRRAADIYKAILDTPIGIVQNKCVADMQRWLCRAEYVVRLAEISETCEHIWYHAQVHLMVLQSVRLAKDVTSSADKAIAELDSRLKAIDSNNDMNFLFDFIIQTLGDLSQMLKESLLSETSTYSLVRQLQSEDKLDCLDIDKHGW